MNEAVKAKIRESTARYYRDLLGLSDWKKRSEDRLTRSYEAHMYRRLEQCAGPLDGKDVLDLGCGWGGVVMHAAGSARRAIGIEPDRERLAIAEELLQEAGTEKASVREGVGESLPFADQSFDVIASYQVLEHVQDPERVIAEVARVLKPGGVFHFSTPNYMAFWEPHYKIAWLPMMPKWLGRVYLRLRRRNPNFLRHINYVNPILIRRLLRRHRFSFVDVQHTSVVAKLERKLEPVFSRLPGGRAIGRLVHRANAALLFAVHTCFLNVDQEYVATKA